jgi:ribosome maturation factor RimP
MMKKTDINKIEILNKINPVIEKIADDLGLIVLETDFVQEYGSWHLQIFIWNEKEQVSHKDCEDVTRGLNDYLDDLIPFPYYLEVSSPGIDRKLKSSKEYNIFKGKKVDIKLKQPLEPLNDKKIEATLVEYSLETGLKVILADTSEEINIQESNISSVRLKVDY